jgi:hypothetical protein
MWGRREGLAIASAVGEAGGQMSNTDTVAPCRSRDDAVRRVQRVLDDEMRNVVQPLGIPLRVIDSEVWETPLGWLVPWSSVKYVQTRRWKHRIFLNHPFLVTKLDGRVHWLRRPCWRTQASALRPFMREHPEYKASS